MGGEWMYGGTGGWMNKLLGEEKDGLMRVDERRDVLFIDGWVSG